MLGKLLQPRQQAAADTTEEARAATPGSQGESAEKQAVGVGQSGKRLALVIGNDAYQNVSKLEKAGSDATTMARELKAAGFEVLLHRNLNYRGMVKAIETLSNSITGGDQVVVFFAGHGVQIKTGSYLLPIDIEASSESEVEKTAYGLADLTDKLSEARASFALVIVDACRDNPLKSRGRSVGSTRGLGPIEPPKGQMVVYSASKGQQALDRLSDRDSNPNGVFTREFVARMKRRGMRIEDLVREVQDAVEELARTVSHEQRPALYNEARGNFYFYGPTTVQVAPQVSGAAAPARTPAEIEDSYWNTIKDDRDSVGFEEYLKQYPKGRYAGQARATLNRLKAEARRSAATAAVPTPALPPVIDDPETLFWNEVKASGAREYLDAYLRQYPRGKYLALAKIELKQLDDRDREQRLREGAEKQQAAERERQEAQRTEQTAWDEAKVAASVAAHGAYLERYPRGRYVALAQAAQQKLQREAGEREKQEAAKRRREQVEAVQRDDAVQWRRMFETEGEEGVRSYLDKHPTKIDELKTLARRGNADAQADLARMYVEGWGVPKDDSDGLRWARSAADQGNSRGQNTLGYAYFNGIGVAKDEVEAVKWYRKAAEQGNARGQSNLGHAYFIGKGVAKDEVEAVKWFRKSAEEGDAGGQLNLGHAYFIGTGVAKDEVEAVKWYRKAAEQGNATGQFNLGVAYETGIGVAKDEVEAVKWYRKTAEQGNARGQLNLGYAYFKGIGVAKNEVEAVKWYRKAAEQGDATGQLKLGVAYKTGTGVAKNEVEAVKWSRKAAEQGNADGQWFLGYAYFHGIGLAKDEVEAVKWFRKAAEQGHQTAIDRLRAISR